MPAVGDTVSVYDAGTANLATPLTTLGGGAQGNPITVPNDTHWGFEPPDSRLLDVWWHEGSVYLAKNTRLDSAYQAVQAHLGGYDHDILTTIAEDDQFLASLGIYLGATEPDLTTLASFRATRTGYWAWIDTSAEVAKNLLAVQNLVSASGIDNVVLSLTGGTLTVQGLASTSGIDNVTLTNPESSELVVQNLSSTSAISNVTLVQAHGDLVVAGMASTSSLDNVTLVLKHGVLTVSNMSSASSLDNVVITESGGTPLVVSDNFNRANGSLGSNWSVTGELAISSNKVICPNNDDEKNSGVALWVGGPTSGDMYVEGLATTNYSAQVSGVCYRGIAALKTGVANAGLYIYDIAAGTTLASMDTTDTYVRLEIEGTTARAYTKATAGGSWTLRLTKTAAPLIAQTFGVFIEWDDYNGGIGAIVDDWAAGSL